MDCKISVSKTLYTCVALHQTARRLLDTMKFLDFDKRSHLAHYILVSIVYLHLHYQPSSANPVCYTESCIKIADYYHKNMNEQGKPCIDFYDYVCHNWGVHNPRPKYKTLWNVDHWQRRKSSEALKHALENLQPTKEPYESAKGLFTACMNLPFMGRKDSNSLKSIMGTAGNWPMFTTKDSKVSQNVPWWEIESYYISRTGESSILDFHLAANTRRNNMISIFMAPPYSAYGMLKFFAPFHVSHKKQYKTFLMDVIKSVAPFDTKKFADVIRTDLDDVIQFREKINKINKFPDIGNASVLITLEEFQQFQDEHAAGQETAKIKWSEVIRALYKNSRNHYLLAVQSTPHMIVTLPYFSDLATLLAATPKRVIVNHIHLYFAERHLELSTQMETNLENSLIRGPPPTAEIRYDQGRWLNCLGDQNLLRPLGDIYIEANFPEESKKEVEDLLKELVQFLKARISESSWLTTDVINKTLHKLDNVRSQIGYPRWYYSAKFLNNTPILPDVNPILADAFYAPKLNRIGVSAAFLQWPVFMPNMPYAVKYGATGSTIGHELNHAVDSIGLQFDEYGVKKNVWPNATYEEYFRRANCFIGEYKKYQNIELRKRNITKTPEAITLNEDIADVMGLKIAYMGYREQLRKNNGICPILPHFEKFGCERLFFIAYANVFCAASTPWMEENLLLRDTHSFPRVRINGAVGNMKEFYEAFQCKPKDPKKMCDIWK